MLSINEKKFEIELRALGLESSFDDFVRYLELLFRWNKAYNLTAVRDPNEMIYRHILDSLAILPWLRGNRWIDVGSGAGLPGIPLALARRDATLVLLDSNGKKTRFLMEVKSQLKLDHVEIVQARAENYHPFQPFDTLLARAFSDLKQILSWTSHLLMPNGLWLLMKGKYPEHELLDLQRPFEVKHYAVNGVLGARCCVMIENNKN